MLRNVFLVTLKTNFNVFPWFLFSLVDYIFNIFKKSFCDSISLNIFLGTSKINITTKVKTNQKIIYFCKLKINNFFYWNQGLMNFWCNALNTLNFIILLFIYLFSNSLFFKKAFSKLKKKLHEKHSPHFILILILGQIVANSFRIIIKITILICYKNVSN